MKYFWYLAVATILLSGCSKSDTGSATLADSPASSLPTVIADTVYKNGKIYTVNGLQPWAEAVAIQGGSFIVVGSNADAKSVTGESTEVVDLDGAFDTPATAEPYAASPHSLAPFFASTSLITSRARARARPVAGVQTRLVRAVGGRRLLSVRVDEQAQEVSGDGEFI